MQTDFANPISASAVRVDPAALGLLLGLLLLTLPPGSLGQVV